MSEIPEGIPADVWKTVSSLAMQYVEWLIPKPSEYGQSEHVLAVTIARAIMAEREKWQAAVTYFERYCQDEAEDVEHCVCGEQQHEDAKAFAAAIRSHPQQGDVK